MGRGVFCNSFERRRHLFSVHEIHECRLRVSPSQIGKKLIDSFAMCLLSTPELAFCHEDILPLVPHQDIRFPGFVEGFPGCVNLESRLQVENQMVPQRLFVLVRIRARQAFKNAPRVEYGL